MTGNPVRNTKFILIAFGGFLLFGLLLLLVAHGRAKGRLAAAKKALQSAGEVFEIQRIAPSTVSGDSNGAVALINAAQSVPRIEDAHIPPSMKILGSGRALLSSSVKELPVRKANEWTTNVWEELEPVIEPFREQMLIINQAAEKEVIQISLDYEQGWNLRLPHLATLKTLINWITVAVVYDLRHGDFPAAYTNLLTGSRITAKWRDEPFVISQLVRHAMLRTLVMPLWELLQHDRWSEVQLKELQGVWEGMKLWSDMERAFQMERAMGLGVFEMVWRDPDYRGLIGGDGYSRMVVETAGDGLNQVFRNPRKGLKKLFVDVPGLVAWPLISAHDDQLWYLEQSQNNLDSVREGMRSNSVVVARAKYASKPTSQPPEVYWLSRMMGSIGAKSIDRTGETEAIRALCVTAIALKRFKLKNGVYPDQLIKLVPEFLSKEPIDAIDGKPLRYQLESDGRYSLWSIGKDAGDDGGDRTPDVRKPDWTNGPDLVWPWSAEPSEVEAYKSDLLHDIFYEAGRKALPIK